MSYTLDAIIAQAEDNYPMTATLSPEVVAVLLFALSSINNRRAWLDYQNDPEDEITPAQWEEIQELLDQGNYAVITPEVGFIRPYITTDPPDNTIPCDGGTYNREDYPLLYAVIDAVFIIDADTFTVPDLTGRVLVGAGVAGTGTTFSLGDTGGEETHELTTAEIPAHSHSDIGHTHSIELTTDALAVAPGELPVVVPIPLIPGSTGSGNANLTDTGGGEAHNNMQPFGVVKYCVVAR
jgi:microcystin-dependent protein